MQKRSSNTVRIFYPRFKLDELVAKLQAGIPALARHLDLRKVVLFGSYARGRQTVASDIDLLVVYAGEPPEDAYALIKQSLRIPGLEPHAYSQEEYEAMRETVERMARDGIIIFQQ